MCLSYPSSKHQELVVEIVVLHNCNGQSLWGYKQRQAQAEAAQPGSELAATLVREWAWGRIPTDLVQRLAQAGLHDIRVSSVDVGGHKAIRELEVLASWELLGAKVAICTGILMAKLAPSQWPEPYKLDVPMLRGNRQFWKPIGLLLPHEVFAMLYLHYNDHWGQGHLPRRGWGGEFWRTQRGNPQFHGHPLFAEASLRRPFLWHCMGMASPLQQWARHGQRALMSSLGKAFWQRGAWRPWSPTSFFWLMYSNLYVKTFGLDTTRPIWKVVAWELQSSSGWHVAPAWPQRPSFSCWVAGCKNGWLPLAGGWKGLLVTIRGDLIGFRKCCIFSGQCFYTMLLLWCDSRDGLHSLSDFRDQARWKTVRGVQVMLWIMFYLRSFLVSTDLLSRWTSCTPSTWGSTHICVVGFWCCCVINLTWHCWRESPEHLRASQRAERHPSMFGSMTLSMFCDKDSPHMSYPKLKGKAAEVKTFLRPCCPLATCQRSQQPSAPADPIGSAEHCEVGWAGWWALFCTHFAWRRPCCF